MKLMIIENRLTSSLKFIPYAASVIRKAPSKYRLASFMRGNDLYRVLIIKRGRIRSGWGYHCDLLLEGVNNADQIPMKGYLLS